MMSGDVRLLTNCRALNYPVPPLSSASSDTKSVTWYNHRA